MERSYREPSETSKTAHIAASRRRSRFSFGKPMVPIQHLQDSGTQTSRSSRTPSARQNGTMGLRQGGARGAIRREHGLVSREREARKAGRDAFHNREGEAIHRGLVVTSYRQSRTEMPGQGLSTSRDGSLTTSFGGARRSPFNWVFRALMWGIESRR